MRRHGWCHKLALLRRRLAGQVLTIATRWRVHRSETGQTQDGAGQFDFGLSWLRERNRLVAGAPVSLFVCLLVNSDTHELDLLEPIAVGALGCLRYQAWSS